MVAAVALAACGGGSSTTVSYSGPGLLPGSAPVLLAVQDTPTGSNTTEVVVDAGPPGFGTGSVNVPYVTVTVCAPNSRTACATIDHVILDTGSYGLRVLRSKVQPLGLPLLQLAASPISGTAVECYQFVVGGLWGPLANADVLIAGETASQIPIQLIDDLGVAGSGPSADCLVANSNQVLTSAAALQGNGVLGVGMVSLDCGKSCALGDYAGQHVQYYVCPDTATANCQPAAISNGLQTQNPVAHFAANNNGTIISLPKLPTYGAVVAKGRLVFGIGTQANNQITPAASSNTLRVDTNPANYLTTYLYFNTQVGGRNYSQSYIDSGSNALFFDDSTLPQNCQTNSGAAQGWYCPNPAQDRQAVFSDLQGDSVNVGYPVGNADWLFGTPEPTTGATSTAFANLAGAVNLALGTQTFDWGLPFFFGRSVYTSIWGQTLSANGPWYAF